MATKSTDSNASKNSAEVDAHDDKKSGEIDESGYKFIQDHKWKWCLFYFSYVFNNANRSLFSLLFLGQGTGFRWLVAGAIFQTLFGDLIISGWVSYQSDRMDKLSCGLGYRKYYLNISLLLTVAGSVGLALGLAANNSIRGVLYLVFGTISYCGQAISENIRIPYLIENTSCQSEYVKFNSYYLVLTGIISAVICVVIFQVFPLAAVIIGFVLLFPGIRYIYQLPEVPHRNDKQPDLIPAVRITIDNPIGSQLLYANIFISLSSAFDGLVIQLIQLNWDFLLTVSNLATLIIVGFLISIPILAAALYKFKRDLETTGDKYEMMTWSIKSLLFLYLLGFTLACMAYYWQDSIYLFLILAFTFVIFFRMYINLALNVMIRDACYLDAMYTGINRFSLYNMAITRPGAVLLTIIGSLLFTFLRLTGYEELEDDDLDDNIDTRIDFTADTIWYLRFMTMLGSFVMLSVAWYIFEHFPLDEPRSKKLDELVTEKLKESESSSSEGDKNDENKMGRGSFMGQAVAEAERRLSMEATESGTETNKEQRNPLNNSAVDESGLPQSTSLFSAETITTMMHLSVSELNELRNPNMIVNDVLNEMSYFNTANMILPLLSSGYIISFIIFCFAIGFFDTIDIQALVLIVTALIGLYHYLRKNVLIMLKGLRSDEVHKLAEAGKTAREESLSYLQLILDNLKTGTNKSERTVSASKQLSSWFNTNKDGNIIASKWLNLGTLLFSCTTLIVYISVSVYYFGYA